MTQGQSFIRKGQAHELFGISRQSFYNCLTRCKKAGEPMPQLLKHRHMEIYGYRVDDLIHWWYENEVA